MMRLVRWAVLRSPQSFFRPPPLRFFSARDPITDLSQEISRLKSDPQSDTLALPCAYMQLSMLYLKQWKLTEAKSTLLSLQSLLANSPSGHSEFAGECFYELGEVCYNLQESAEAKKHYEAALSVFKSERKRNTLNIAKTYYGLGNTHQSLGDFPEALRCFEEAEKLADAAGANKDNLLSMIRQGYAFIDRMKNKLDDAMSHVKLAVELVEKKTDRSSNQILADAYECQGDIHLARAERKEALEMFNKSLNLKNVIFPSHHPEVGKTMGKLGACIFASGNVTEALSLFSRKLEIDIATLGVMHSTVANDYHDIGFANVHLHRMEDANNAYMHEINILKSLPNCDQWRIASTYLNLLNVKLNMRQYSPALEYGLKGVAILRQQPRFREQLGFALSQIGEIHMQMKRLNEAKKYFEEAHELKKSLYPADNVEIGRSLILLGQAKGMLSEKQEAEEHLVKGVAILRKQLKPDDVTLAVALAKQGTAFASNRKIEEAITSFKEAVIIFRKKTPQASVSVVNSSLQLISLFMANKMFLEAENQYRRLISDIEAAQKQSAYDFSKMVKSLYALLQAQDKQADCAHMRAKYNELLNS